MDKKYRLGSNIAENKWMQHGVEVKKKTHLYVHMMDIGTSALQYENTGEQKHWAFLHVTPTTQVQILT